MKKLMILGVILILAGGCKEQEGEGAIVGKWKQIGATQTMEFFKDGTVIVADKGEPPLAGDYRFIDDNRIRINLALFGPINADVSPSRDEITLTNPFGKVEKYGKTGVENKKAEEKKSIVGKYVVDKEPGVIIFEEGGTMIRHLAGRWEIKRGWIKLYEGDKEIEIGGMSSDTIKYGGRTFIKQRGAEAIQLLGIKTSSSLEQSIRVQFAQVESDYAPSFVPVNFTLWSDYVASDNVSILRFRKNGTFSIKEVLDYRWSIEDGVVQVYNEDVRFRGRIKGNTLIFEEGEDKRIFTKQG